MAEMLVTMLAFVGLALVGTVVYGLFKIFETAWEG